MRKNVKTCVPACGFLVPESWQDSLNHVGALSFNVHDHISSVGFLFRLKFLFGNILFL